jgi:hypothetical protein
MNQPYTQWRLIDLKEAAKPYQHRKQFRKGNPNAYTAAHRHGLLDQVCAHMTPDPYKTPIKWTLEMLTTEAMKYTSRWNWRKGSPNSYGAAQRRNLLDAVFPIMEDEW